PRPLADDDRLRRARLRPRAAAQAAALPLATARRDPRRGGARRPPADLAPLRDSPAAELRARRQDPRPGRLDRAHARPATRPGSLLAEDALEVMFREAER